MLHSTVHWEKPSQHDVVIHQSMIETMSLCPAKRGLSWQPGYDDTPSEAMFFGTWFHHLVEYWLDFRRRGMVADLFNKTTAESSIRKLAVKDGFDIDKLTNPWHITKIVDEGLFALSVFVKDVFPKIEAIVMHPKSRLEQELTMPLGMLNAASAVWMRGTPDVIHDQGLIDWKSSGRGWWSAKAVSRIQSDVYVELAIDNGYLDRGQLGSYPMDYWVYDREKRTFEKFTVHSTPESREASLLAVWEYARAEAYGVFPPTPSAKVGKTARGWWCSAKFCGAWNICPYKAMIHDRTDLDKKRSSQWTA